MTTGERMYNKKVFTGCMIRHGGLLAAEAILALAVSVILVQGNKIISGVIDEMLSGRQVLFGSFLLQFLIYTVVGTIAALKKGGMRRHHRCFRLRQDDPLQASAGTVSFRRRRYSCQRNVYAGE